MAAMEIAALCRNFLKFWLSRIKKENKLSKMTYDDIKWTENKAFWSKRIRSTLDQIGLGEFWIKAHYMYSTGIVGTIIKAKA